MTDLHLLGLNFYNFILHLEVTHVHGIRPDIVRSIVEIIKVVIQGVEIMLIVSDQENNHFLSQVQMWAGVGAAQQGHQLFQQPSQKETDPGDKGKSGNPGQRAGRKQRVRRVQGRTTESFCQIQIRAWEYCQQLKRVIWSKKLWV